MTHGRAYLLLVLTFLVWSSSFVATRVLVGEDVPAEQRLDALEFVLARFLPVAVAAWLWLGLDRRARGTARRVVAEQPGRLLLLSLFSVWTYNLAFGFGQNRVPPGTASLVVAGNPTWTFVLTALLGQERPSLRKASGLLVAFAGLYLVVTRGAGRALEPAYWLDAVVLLGAPISWATYTVMSKPVVGRFSPFHLTLITLAVAGLPVLPLAALHPGLWAKVLAWPLERYLAIAFLSIACTLLGYWLWSIALEALPATTASSFTFLNPPLAILSEWLWLGRKPSSGLLLGGLVVLAGVWLVARGGRRTPGVAEPSMNRG